MKDRVGEGQNFVAVSREEAKAQGQHIQHMVQALRKVRNPELFIGLSDDLVSLTAFQPPRELQVRFEDVFDPDQRRNLKIVLHPAFKRWTIFERTWHRGQPLWHPVCMFYTDPVDGVLPQDLVRGDKMWHHMTGCIGEFRDVTRQDLEFVERCDFKKYGWKKVDEFLAQFAIDKAKAEEDQFSQFEQDFLDYNFWLAMRDAQDHHSKPWSTRDVELKSDPSRYLVEEVEGASGSKIKVRRRIYGDEGDLNEMRAVASGKYDKDSASGRAALRILEIKNENYLRRTGVTLWEAATGRKPGESILEVVLKSGDSVAADAENKKQAQELLAMASDLPEERISVEDWLLEGASLTAKVPV